METIGLLRDDRDYDPVSGCGSRCEVNELCERYKTIDREAKRLTKQMKALKAQLITYTDESGEIEGLDGCVYATYKPVTRGTVDRKALEADYKGLFGVGSKYLKSTTVSVFRVK